MILFLMIFCLEADPDFKTRHVFQTISEDSDLLLLSADDVAVAPNGKTYVLDSRSFCIHVWATDGDYSTSFGRKGEGPGEFNFQNNSNAMSFEGTDLYVFDSATGKVTVFDEEGKYLRAFFLDVGRRIVPLFEVIDPETLLISNASWSGAYKRLATYDTGSQLKHKFIQVEDKTWRNTTVNGERHVTLVIYSTTLITGYDETNGEVLTGDNATNKVQISDLNGNPVRELSLELTRRDLTKDIRKGWEEMPWFKQQSFYKLDFPDKLPTYNRIVSFDQGFVFFMQLNPERESRGIVTDRAGKTLFRFHTAFGDGGGLFGSNGQLITVRADDMGELTIRRVMGEKP